jgi:hypothetical protein
VYSVKCKPQAKGIQEVCLRICYIIGEGLLLCRGKNNLLKHAERIQEFLSNAERKLNLLKYVERKKIR